MKYAPIPQQLFVENRKRFCAAMKPGGIAVFHSNDIMPTNADGTMPFRQNNDLFYLSGIDQEETILLLCPDYYDPSFREILFVRETSEYIKVWEGKKLNKQEAREASGIRKVMWTSDFYKVFQVMVTDCNSIYMNSNEHIRSSTDVESRDRRFITWVQNKYPLHQNERSAVIMHSIRSIKSSIEIELIKKACQITRKAFLRILPLIKPGISEHEIEAEIWHEFLMNKSRGPAYYPIIASGANSCILHYNDNDKICKEGEVLLLDFGCEYANYASDLSRTVPISGQFNARQLAIYNAVLRVMRGATKMLIPGNTIDKYHEACGLLMEEELIKLGLLDADEVKKQDPDAPLYKKYFMHGTSHQLGLDVHDVGRKHVPFTAGMVFTCEPGIYVPKEEIGIRIENDIYITENGPVDLMLDIPIEASDIEHIMKTGKVLS